MPAKKVAKKSAKSLPSHRIARAKLPAPVIVSLTEMTFCHTYLKTKFTNPKDAARAAGEEVGIGPAEGERYLARANVKAYLLRYQAAFMERMADNEARKFFNRGITRETIAERYMQLADMPPQTTKDSVEGQIQALDSLVILMGFKIDPSKFPGIIGGLTDEQLKELDTPTQTKQ